MGANTDTIGAGEPYETNAEWETARDGESGLQTGQLKGEDGGEVNFAGAVGSMLLKALSGARHAGKLVGGAFPTGVAHINRDSATRSITVNDDNVRIDGIAINNTYDSDGTFCNTVDNLEINGTLYYWNVTSNSNRNAWDGVMSTGHRFTNNVCIRGNGTGSGNLFFTFYRTTTVIDEFSHNSFVQESGADGNTYAYRAIGTITADQMHNNAMLCSHGISHTGTINTRSNNATADTSGDSGHTSLTDTDVFTDPANGDPTPVADSNIYQAGTDRTAEQDCDTDVSLVTRPTTPDIGAIETVGVSVDTPCWPIFAWRAGIRRPAHLCRRSI